MNPNDAMSTLHHTGEAMGRMQDTAKAKLTDVSNRLAEGSKVAAVKTDAYIHEYAWSSIALAAVVGVVIGLLVRRS